MRRGLVTGGCGFIGSNLVRELVEQGWTVDVVDDMSSGNLSLLDGLKIRVVPAGLLEVFYSDKAADPENRMQEEVHVIQGDFADHRVLKNISDEKYDVVFHQAAIPRVSFSVENPSLTTDVNISSKNCIRFFIFSLWWRR